MSIIEIITGRQRKPGHIEWLQHELRNDKEYLNSWQASIAMAFKDEAARYKKEHDKQSFSKDDLHIIANRAADEFLTLLSKK